MTLSSFDVNSLIYHHMDLSTRVRPLRGRVVIRPSEVKKIGLIHIPDMASDWDRKAQHSQGKKAKSSHTGEVIAMGPPALASGGQEIPPGFEVGDMVQFVFVHNEKEFTKEWVDGTQVVWVPQECVIAVHLADGAKAETN